MLKEDCERIGVLECGAAFQKIGFMFREQPIGDYGIDAIIETRDDKYLSGKLIAVQIKSALKDCYELMEGDTLQIEVNGDVSVINKNKGRYQKEVKHHFGEKNLSDRDIEFWKTLANWYTDYERLKGFSNFILSTTSIITTDSPFSKWNELDKHEKLACITEIGAEHKEREETFRKQYNRIFCDSFDENQLQKLSCVCRMRQIED